MAIVSYTYVTSSAITPIEPDIDLSLLRMSYDNSDEKKAEKLRKKLLRIRSLGK